MSMDASRLQQVMLTLLLPLAMLNAAVYMLSVLVSCTY